MNKCFSYVLTSLLTVSATASVAATQGNEQPATHDPFCERYRVTQGGVAEIAKSVALEGETLILVFKDQTFRIPQSEVLEKMYNLTELFQEEVDRGWLPFGAIIEYRKGEEWFSISTGYTVDKEGRASDCKLYLLKMK